MDGAKEYVGRKLTKKLRTLDKLYRTGTPLDLIFFGFCALPLLVFFWSVVMTFVARQLLYIVLVLNYMLGKRLNKVLKRVIAQKRPNKDSHGMPSFHSQISFFYSTFAHYRRASAPISVSIGLHVVATAVSYGRVHLGKHTWEQIIVGMLVGVVQGLLAAVAMQKLEV